MTLVAMILTGTATDFSHNESERWVAERKFKIMVFAVCFDLFCIIMGYLIK